MTTEAGIKAKYKTLHDELSEGYYSGTRVLSKEQFDLQHGKIWTDMKVELITEGYLTPPKPPRDLAAAIDRLEARLRKLEEKG